jgi:hypothetical protein
MGKEFDNLTWDDLCNLMCGEPEKEDNEEWVEEQVKPEAVAER